MSLSIREETRQDISDPSPVTAETSLSLSKRPPIEYSSFRAFARSFKARFASLWTRRFMLSLLAGQIISLCITCANVTTTELIQENWALPLTQAFILYFAIFVIYTPYTISQYGLKGWSNLVIRDGWKYFLLALCDVEGNFLIVKGYQVTDLWSSTFLNSTIILACMSFRLSYMKMKYHWTQTLGKSICIVGFTLSIWSDTLIGQNYPAPNQKKGLAFMFGGAILYAISNASEEFFVRKSPLYEVVGQLGMWGTLINGIQAAALEYKGMKTATWSGFNIGMLVAYTSSMIIVYTVAPLLFRLASSVYFNLSSLTSDFYGLLFGLFLYHFSPYWLCFLAYATIIMGLIVYFWHATPEEQGMLDPKVPVYVQRVRGQETDVPPVSISTVHRAV